MVVPSPASMKKMHDEKRASETTQQEKVSSTSKQKTSTGRNTTVSRNSSSKQQSQDKKSVSTPESAGKVRSGKSKPSTNSTEGSGNTDRTRQKTKPQRTRSEGGSKTTNETSSKKPFVRKKHLTQKPLRGHEGLESLKSSLTKSTTGKGRQVGRESKTAPRRNPKRPTVDEKLLTSLREQVDQYELVDISNGSEKAMGVSVTKMVKAVEALEKEGYHRYYLQIKAVGTDDRVVIRVLTIPSITFKDLVARRNDIGVMSINKENN